MQVTLDKNDLITLVMGTTPYYSVMENEALEMTGSFDGGHMDKWYWYVGFAESLSEAELWDLYVLCRDSWL